MCGMHATMMPVLICVRCNVSWMPKRLVRLSVGAKAAILAMRIAPMMIVLYSISKRFNKTHSMESGSVPMANMPVMATL